MIPDARPETGGPWRGLAAPVTLASRETGAMSADGHDSSTGLASFAKKAKSAMTKQLREVARQSPDADAYEPKTLWDRHEKGERTKGVRVSGATSEGQQEVRLDIWRRAPGTPEAFARAAASTEGWSKIPDEAGGTVFQRGPVTLVGDEAKNTATLVYSERQEKPFSASSFRMYLGALFDELVKLAASPAIDAPADSPTEAPQPEVAAPEDAGQDAGPDAPDVPPPATPASDEPLAAVAVDDDDDDDAPVAEIFEFVEVDDFDEAEVVTEAGPPAEPEPAPESAPVEQAPPEPAPPEPAPAAPGEEAPSEPVPQTYASPDELLAALESGALKIIETTARTEIEGHDAVVAVTGEGRRKQIDVTVEGMGDLDASAVTGCRIRLGDRTYSAKLADGGLLIMGKKSPAHVIPPPAIREAMDYAAKFIQGLAQGAPVPPPEPLPDITAVEPPAPEAEPPSPPQEEAPAPADAPADNGIEVEEVSLDDLLGPSEDEAPEPAEDEAPAPVEDEALEPPEAPASADSLPEPPPEEDDEKEEEKAADTAEAADNADDDDEGPQVPEDVPETPFGDFQPKRWIGRDVLGVLYEGEHTTTGQPAAIKVIDQEHTRNAKFAKDFVREGWTASKLEHAGLNRILTVGRTPLQVYFYASEFAEAKSARAVVRSGEGFTHDDAKRVVRTISEALAYVHENKLYHGDVRPSYILLTADGGAKLAEMAVPKNTLGCVDRLLQARGWGMADALREGEVEAPKEMHAIIRERRVVCHYLAPELADPRFKADGRADVYGLGATWYYMLTGKAPFAELPALKLLMGEAGKVPPPEELKADIPQATSAVIQKMMDPFPSERYQTMEEVVAAIDAL